MDDRLYWYKGVITNIVDGDTVDILINLGLYIQITLRLRLSRINAPEMRGPERPKGIESTNWATDRLLNKKVIIHTNKDDAFGRWIAEIYLDEVCINDEMVQLGYASYKEY